MTKLTGGRVPDLYVDADVVAGDLVHLTLYRGTVAAVAVAAILIAPALIPRTLAARMMAATVLMVGLLYTPGVPLAIFHATDLGRVLWRLMWAVPVAALVGTLAVRIVSERASPVLRVVPAIAIVVVVAIAGTPPWNDRAARGLKWPPVFKRFPEELASARAAVRVAEPGDLVWSTRKMEQTVGILSPEVRTVNARGFFTTAMEGEPAALDPRAQAPAQRDHATASTPRPVPTWWATCVRWGSTSPARWTSRRVTSRCSRLRAGPACRSPPTSSVTGRRRRRRRARRPRRRRT